MASGTRDQKRAVPAGAGVRDFIDDGSAPDVYADEFWMTTNDVSATFTLLVAVPPLTPGASGVAPRSRVVARIRMSPQLALKMGQLVTTQLAGKIVTLQADQPADGPKN